MFNERLFRAKVVFKGLTLAEVAKAIGINEATLSRKIKNNGSFTREEIAKLILTLDLTTEEVAEIFFANNIAET